MTTTSGTAFAASVGVIDRIHCNAAHLRPATEPADTARFAHLQILVLGIAYLAHRRTALIKDLTKLT